MPTNVAIRTPLVDGRARPKLFVWMCRRQRRVGSTRLILTRGSMKVNVEPDVYPKKPESADKRHKRGPPPCACDGRLRTRSHTASAESHHDHQQGTHVCQRGRRREARPPVPAPPPPPSTNARLPHRCGGAFSQQTPPASMPHALELAAPTLIPASSHNTALLAPTRCPARLTGGFQEALLPQPSRPRRAPAVSESVPGCRLCEGRRQHPRPWCQHRPWRRRRPWR